MSAAAVSSWPVDYLRPGDRIEGYLSRILQDGLSRPDALVVCRRIQDRESWLLLRKGENDIELGDSFSNAKQAAHALARAERARNK